MQQRQQVSFVKIRSKVPPANDAGLHIKGVEGEILPTMSKQISVEERLSATDLSAATCNHHTGNE